MACRAIEMSAEKEKRTCPRSGNLYFNDKKYQVRLSHELADIIPSFSILRIKKEGSIKKTVAKPSS